MKERDKRERKWWNIKVDKELWIELKLICIDMDITPSEYIEKLLQRVIRENPFYKKKRKENDN